MIIRCSCRSSFRLLLHFHAQNSRHISRPPRRVRGKKRGKPLIYIAPYVLGASRSSRSDSTRLRLASSCSGFVRPLFGVVRLRLEFWQGSRRRPRVCGCGWCPGVARLAAVVLALVLTLPAVAVSLAAGGVMGGGWCCTLAAFLGARLRPVCGPCGGVAGAGLAVLLAWPLRAAFRWRWRGLDRLRVVLAAVAVRTAPAAAVAVAGASIKRARRRGPYFGPWWRCAGGVVRLSKNGRGWRCWRGRLCGGRGGCRTRGAVVARSNGHGLGPFGPWGLVLLGVVILEGDKAGGGVFG